MVLKELFVDPKTKQIAVRRFAIRPRTSLPKEIEKRNLINIVQGDFATASELVDNYQVTNQKQRKLTNEFNLEIPVILLNEKDLGSTLKKIQEKYPKDEAEAKFNEIYNQRYKGMAVTFSNVGFNKERNQALLHVEFDISGLRNGCSGQFVLLVKQSNIWTITHNSVSWIS